MPLWSPDGKQLVCTKGKFDKKWAHKTWHMDADGSNAKKLPIPESDEVDDWSRDGKWFVTVSDRHPRQRLSALYHAPRHIMHPDGTGQRRLTKDGLNVYPRFSPDGKRMVYLHQTRKEGNSVRVVDVDGKNDRQILTEEGDISPDFVCFSPDGKRLAVTRFTWQRDETGRKVGRDPEAQDFHIEIMNADGKNRRRLDLADAKIVWLGHGEWR